MLCCSPGGGGRLGQSGWRDGNDVLSSTHRTWETRIVLQPPQQTISVKQMGALWIGRPHHRVTAFVIVQTNGTTFVEGRESRRCGGGGGDGNWRRQQGQCDGKAARHDSHGRAAFTRFVTVGSGGFRRRFGKEGVPQSSQGGRRSRTRSRSLTRGRVVGTRVFLLFHKVGFGETVRTMLLQNDHGLVVIALSPVLPLPPDPLRPDGLPHQQVCCCVLVKEHERTTTRQYTQPQIATVSV